MAQILFILDKIDNGGLQKVNAEIANLLSQSYEVDIFILEDTEVYFNVDSSINIHNPVELDKNYMTKLNIIKSINFVNKKIFKKTAKFRLSFQFQYLKRYIENYSNIDLVVLSGFSILFADMIKQNIPYIRVAMWMHNNADRYMNEYFKYEIKYLMSSMKSADKLIVLNQNDLVAYSNYSKNVLMIPNPITTLANRTSNLREKRILTVARVKIYQKGLDYLVKLANEIPDDWEIDLVGQGDGKEISRLKKLISDESVEKKLVLQGPKNTEELKKYYENSSIFLSTSRWEGFGLVLIEAMNFGLPVISFKQSGSIDILDNGRYGVLVNQGDLKQMAIKLNEIIDSLPIRQDMQKLSLERVGNYSPNKIKQEWKNLIDD